MLLLGRPVKDDVALGRSQLVEWYIGAHAHLAGNLLHEIPHERAPGKHRAFIDGLGLIGNQTHLVHLARDTGAAAGWACTAAVERQVLGIRRVELAIARRAPERQTCRHVEARLHTRATVRTHVMCAAAKEQAQTVVELGHGAKGRTHAWHAGALVQRQGRRHVQHLVHLCMFGLRKATACVGAERFQIAARSFGIEHAQCQRALARTRDTGDAHKLPQRNVDVDIFQVMDACTAHLDSIRLLRHRHRFPSVCLRQSSQVKYVKYSVRTSSMRSQGTSRST